MKGLFSWRNNGEKEEKKERGGRDETADPGYEWVLEDDSSDDEWQNDQRPYEYKGFSIRQNEDGNIYYIPRSDSPVQSNVDFLREACNDTNIAIHNYERAFDFEKSLREVGDVRITLGGQAPHWVGVPQVSLNRHVTDEKSPQLNYPWNSDFSLVSEGQVEVGFGMDQMKRSPSPPSFIDISSGGSAAPEASRTRYSIMTDGLNPFNLVGDDAYDLDEETSAIDGISEVPLKSSCVDSPEAYKESENMIPTPVACQHAIKESHYTPEEYERILDSIFGKAYEHNPQRPQAEDNSSNPIPQPHPFFTPVPPRSPGRPLIPPNANVGVPVTAQELPFAQSSQGQYPISRNEENNPLAVPLSSELPAYLVQDSQGRWYLAHPNLNSYGSAVPLSSQHPSYDPGPQGMWYSAQPNPNLQGFEVPISAQYPNNEPSSQGIYSYPEGTNIEGSQPQPQPDISKQGKTESHKPTLVEETIKKQIEELNSQLKFAYDQLEKSEVEKRALIQKLSYLRLMELELNELQALTRIVNATVPAEEDVEILDRIIQKIRGPKYPPKGL